MAQIDKNITQAQKEEDHIQTRKKIHADKYQEGAHIKEERKTINNLVKRGDASPAPFTQAEKPLVYLPEYPFTSSA